MFSKQGAKARIRPTCGANAVADFEDEDNVRVPIPDEPVIVPFDDARRRRDRAAEGEPQRATVVITAAPYVWIDPATIPVRDWLYGRLLVRRFLTVTIAPGGVGKSSMIAAEALAMVSGRNLLDIEPVRRLKVWLWNLEDPQEETTRKVQAAAKHFDLQPQDIEGQLFVNSGRDHALVIAKEYRNGSVVVMRPVIDNLVQQISENAIDIVIIDPFVSCHEVSENDNSAIDMIAKEWSRVAELANCAVHLVHHTRKSPAGTEITTDSSRGAKALTDAARVARALNQMTEDEGVTAGVENHRLYFRAINDKTNLAPPASVSVWFKIASVWLDNAPGGGDSVGVVTPWTWPDPMSAVTTFDFEKVAIAIRKADWRKDVRSTSWVGKAVASALDLDLDKKSDKAKVATLIKGWLDNGSLMVVDGFDEQRRPRQFVQVCDAE
ncbi:recombinase RecA [Bradyrhizobium zhanjiangense]|uniref:Recombinase RecA n=1 Tax=Bradyrhizobium zhanjiangense TaxID=1325107 RepID=A0ABY0DH47_9BRAD|nr:recombinase RecA [Bradyrhizobium zhanjiangense]